MFCQKCGAEIVDESQKFCHKCGAALEGEKQIVNHQTNEKKQKRKTGGITARINSLTGGEGKVNLHLKDLMSGVFRHHSSEETEQLFICGTSTTTPNEADIVSEWPKPWLYSRVIIILLLLYFGLTFMWINFGNPYALMNIPIIGTLIFPMGLLVLLFEMNVPRNISIIKTVKVFLVGGVTSLFLVLILFQIAPYMNNPNIYAIVIGCVEEIGKFIICAYFISKHKGKVYLLNGILYGGAVGTGFAVFESIGYALYNGINYAVENLDGTYPSILNNFYVCMLDIVKTRGFLSPGGHIAWAAVEGFAIILAMEGLEFSWDVLVNPKFLRIIWIPIVLHAFWDTSFLAQGSLIYIKYGFLIVFIWIVLLVFISRGLQEISDIHSTVQKEEENVLQ